MSQKPLHGLGIDLRLVHQPVAEAVTQVVKPESLTVCDLYARLPRGRPQMVGDEDRGGKGGAARSLKRRKDKVLLAGVGRLRPPRLQGIRKHGRQRYVSVGAFRFGVAIGALGPEFFLNHGLIPRLCRKGGVPQNDLRGKITSHRARSTIATQLFNAKEPMSLFELQEWLGHRMPSSTQRYAKITPTKLMKSYSDAGYFGRNLRAIEVLIDQEKVRNGVGAAEAWKFYDLGHGYCTYDFFDQCPHRMACAKCSFYMPKGSTMAALLEGKNNLLRMRQEIPLSDAELAALDDGVSALESLLSRLADVPTPAGPTPLQLRDTALVQIEAAD